MTREPSNSGSIFSKNCDPLDDLASTTTTIYSVDSQKHRVNLRLPNQDSRERKTESLYFGGPLKFIRVTGSGSNIADIEEDEDETPIQAYIKKQERNRELQRRNKQQGKVEEPKILMDSSDRKSHPGVIKSDHLNFETYLQNDDVVSAVSKAGELIEETDESVYEKISEPYNNLGRFNQSRPASRDYRLNGESSTLYPVNSIQLKLTNNLTRKYSSSAVSRTTSNSDLAVKKEPRYQKSSMSSIFVTKPKKKAVGEEASSGSSCYSGQVLAGDGGKKKSKFFSMFK